MFHFRADNKYCAFLSNNPIKARQNSFKFIKKTEDAFDHLYILHCSTPQENVLKNSDFFTHSHLRKY